MTEPDAPAPLATVGERYVLVERIHSDAHHEVWRGHDDLASRPVKVTRFLDTTDAWRRDFGQRARALEGLSDPGIATVLRHDSDDDPPWLASAWVDGDTVAHVQAEEGLSVDDALAVIGQAALALSAARAAGIGHGRLDADRIVIRADGSIALVGFAVDASPSPDADLRALGAVAGQLIDRTDAGLRPEVVRFLDSLAGNGDKDPADLGRTALALASAHRTGASGSAIATGADTDATAPEPRRPWYDDDERKRIRNRLIALGAIVVIGGAFLLRIISSGAGQATVPPVIGLPWVQAQHQLNELGFRASETLTTGPVGSVGTVIAQDPPGGTRTKVGAIVHLTVVTAETR